MYNCVYVRLVRSYSRLIRVLFIGLNPWHVNKDVLYTFESHLTTVYSVLVSARPWYMIHIHNVVNIHAHV